MQRKKSATKPKKISTSKRAKSPAGRSDGNGTRPTASSKSGHNNSKNLSADELMLRVWQKIYDDHHPVKKARAK
jgi:hypothetical protein